MTKRILAALLVVLMLVTMLAACDKDTAPQVAQVPGTQATEPAPETGDVPTNPTAPSDQPTDTLVFTEYAEIELGTPAATLDPKDVYADLEYNEKMFYGDYRILGGEAAEEKYKEEMPLMSYVAYDEWDEEYYDRYITTVPFRLEAGPRTLYHALNSVRGKEFVRAYFYDEDYNMTYIFCQYTVDGDTLTLTPLAYYDYDYETNHMSFSLSETSFEYTFSFEGRKLTLSDGTTTVELHSGLSYDSDSSALYIDSYLTPGSDMLEEIDNFSLYWYWTESYEEEGVMELRNHFSVADADFENMRSGYAVLEKNGLITFSLPAPGRQVNTYQFVYFLCGDDGIILTDGETTIYFTSSYSDRYGEDLGDNLTYEDLGKLENMTDEEIEEIMEMKADLLNDLADAYEEAGLDVTVDEETGEITMDAEVLFDYNSYAISADGEALLEEFITIYCEVVFDEKYDGFISQIMVEGHTDSTGDYDDNLELSQNRAESVRDFCVSVGGDHADALTEMMNPIGYASNYPVLDSDGNEDEAASRRVGFRFLINLGE